MPHPPYSQTGGDLPAVGQANLRTPDEYQPHPMHVWHNSPQFRKSRVSVEIQIGRSGRFQVASLNLFTDKRSHQRQRLRRPAPNSAASDLLDRCSEWRHLPVAEERLRVSCKRVPAAQASTYSLINGVYVVS